MNKTLHVSGLSDTLDEAGLKQLFTQHGSVESVKIAVDKATGKPKGYGYVTMSTVEDAEKGIKQLHNTTLNDSKITVELKKEMETPQN